MNTKNTLAATAVLALGTLVTQAAESSVKNVVLVHGGFVDGSGWSQVYRGLRKDGYNVAIVQNPTTSLADDVAATKLVISQISGTVILQSCYLRLAAASRDQADRAGSQGHGLTQSSKRSPSVGLRFWPLAD